jgi:hypothetical protein
MPGLKPGDEGFKILNAVLSEIAAQYASLLPHVGIPLSKTFSVSFPPNKLPISLPTQHGKLNGEVDVPGMNTSSAISLSGVIFLSDGVHVFLTAGAPATTVFPYKTVQNQQSYPNQAALDEAIRSKEDDIKKFRDSMQPRLSQLKVKNADTRIWVSQAMLGLVSSTFNSLTPAERTFHYHTIIVVPGFQTRQ